jgi:hypothetical protein
LHAVHGANGFCLDFICWRAFGRRDKIQPMRTASVLLVMVVILAFVTEARAQATLDEIEAVKVRADYSISLGKQKFGFCEGSNFLIDGRVLNWSRMFVGPIGSFDIPCSAIQGLVGFCLIIVVLFALITIATARWK